MKAERLAADSVEERERVEVIVRYVAFSLARLRDFLPQAFLCVGVLRQDVQCPSKCRGRRVVSGDD